MKHNPQPYAWLALASGLLAPAAHGALRAPYTADSYTPHLYHFSEAAGVSLSANAGSAGLNVHTIDANPATGATVTSVLGAAGLAGFGNAADFGTNVDYLAGFDANNTSAFQTDQSNVILSPDAITMNTLGIGGAGAFTLEAMVKFSAEPTANHEIICTDSSAGSRGFQFRLTNTAPTGGTVGKYLEFNLIGVGGAQRKALIPTLAADPVHGYAANTWFHVAFVYTGTTCQFYWTKVDASITAPNALTVLDNANVATPALGISSAAATISGPLVIGNENRAVAAEGLRGAIDEVRISNIARGPGQLLFTIDSDADGLDDNWELSYASSLTELSGLGGADADLDGSSDLAEYNASSNPKLAASTPSDIDGDSLLDSYERTTFGNISNQSGDGDPDSDYATNLQEQAAGTLPLDRTSFPDADAGGADGMSDPWEVAWFGNNSALPGTDSDTDGYTNLDEFLANSQPTDVAWTPVKAKLRNRWSFNNSLGDSVGGSNAQVIDPDSNAGAGGTSTLSSTDILLGGGARDTSAYVQLGSNLLQGLKTPVTIELWATQASVQNWSRVFDFGSGTTEYLMMSWTQGTNLAQDNVGWIDTVASNLANTNQPYTLGTEFHIVMTIEPGVGTNSSTLVTWYSNPVSSPELGAVQGSFSTDNQLALFNDLFLMLGRSQFATDATANARYNEVRFWNGALTAEEREFHHDAGTEVINANDIDADGLVDDWEVLHFRSTPEESVATILAKYDADDDPDGDLYDNATEFTDNTDPLDVFSSFDGDADGLPDGWEVFWFRETPEEDLFTITAKFNGTADPDGDTFNNEAEQTAGTNPENSVFTPIDTDGDGLIDSWEMFHFSDLDETAAGNPDGDSGSNLQEQAAGSNPTLASSTITDVDGDAVLDTEEAFKPYTLDADTLHLWHLNDIQAPAADAVSGGTPLTNLANGALMWSPSLPGFGTGLNPIAGRGTANGGILSALPLAADATDNVTLTYAGAEGAFTFEAIVRLVVDLNVAPASVAPLQIVTADDDVAGGRVWQFRIVPIGGPGNTTGTAPLLEFINLSGEVGVQSLTAPLPTGAAIDAVAVGSWYHVAVTYNGNQGTADNLKLYWTLLDPSRTQASQIASLQMTNDLLVATPSDLSIGNEARATGGHADAFAGIVDEVRISSIARGANGFLFVAGADGDSLDDAWEMQYFGDLAQTPEGDFDKDGTDNLTEYRLGLIPNSGTSLFVASRTANGQISWPSVTGVSFTVSRSTTLGTGSWSDIATVPGTAGTASFTDPTPPTGKAFYRITLNP